jgi:D-sedoheptulose 7-phosphate isomerase
MGCKILGFLGFLGRDGRAMTDVCDINLVVLSYNTPCIQEMHIIFR